MWFIFVWLVFVPPSCLPPTSSCPYLHPFSVLCCMLVIVFIPVVYDISPRSNGMGSGSGAQRLSEAEGSSSACIAHGGARPPPSCCPPASTFRVKFKATQKKFLHRRKPMKSILEKAKERKRNFYLIFIRRKED